MAACMEVVMNGLGGGGGQESQDNFCTGSCVATLTAFNAQCSDGGDGDISELLASAESMQPYAVLNVVAVLKPDDDSSKTRELYELELYVQRWLDWEARSKEQGGTSKGTSAGRAN